MRTAGRWHPVWKTDAERFGWTLAPLTPSHDLRNLRLVLDRSLWVELPVAQHWLAAFRILPQSGPPVVSEVRLFPLDSTTRRRPAGEWKGLYGDDVPVPRGGVTARLLRHIKSTQFRSILKELLRKWPKELSLFGLAETAARQPTKSTQGRKGRTELELARMAETYERAHLNGRPPIRAVATRFHLSPSQARDAIFRVRTLGLLSPAEKQGSAGGLLTAQARALLKQHRNTKRRKSHGSKR